MAQAYEQKKDPDGFLYITYTEESTLGGGYQEWRTIFKGALVELKVGYPLESF